MNSNLPLLETEEAAFYNRHMLLPQVGEEGQRRLKGASVLVIGLGGLGCPVAQYLVAAGVGKLTLLDDDFVEESNLQRQVLFRRSDIGRKKVEAAAEALSGLSPYARLVPCAERLGLDNAWELFEAHDLVVDGSDNYPTRYLSNDAAFFTRKPLLYGAIHRFCGQVAVLAPHLGAPCYRCMLPEPPETGSLPNCAEAGVLGALPGIIGTLQAMEAIKMLAGVAPPPLGTLLCYDALDSRFHAIKLRKNEACALCGSSPSIRELAETGVACAAASCHGKTDDLPTWTPEDYEQACGMGWRGQLLDVRQPEEYDRGNIPGAFLLPLPELQSRLGDIPAQGSDGMLVYCQGGKRSAAALQMLLDAGFANVRHLEGGYTRWKDWRSSPT